MTTEQANVIPVPHASAPVDIRAASPRGIYIIWKRDLTRYWRNRTQAVISLTQPLFFLLLIGSGMGAALRGARIPGIGGANYLQFLFPGICCMAVLFNSMLNGGSVIRERELGVLRLVLAAPIDRSAVAIGKVLGSATQASIQGTMVMLLGPIVGVRYTPIAVIEALGIIVCLALAISSLSVMIASGMRTQQTFQIVNNLTVQPMFFMSGAIFPIIRLPAPLALLSHLDPVAYGVDPVRRILLQAIGVAPKTVAMSLFGHPVPMLLDAALLLAFAVVMTSISVFNFRRKD